MLRAGVNDPKNPLVIVGLSDGNVERLKAGYPILAELASFGVNLPGKLTIFHGHTEADMEALLRRYGLIAEETLGSTDPRVDQEAEARHQHKHILIATCGLPRSGKTTWAQRQAYPIVQPDAIRLALYGQRFLAEREPEVWSVARVMVKALFLAGHKRVVLDATNGTRKRRDEWRSPEWGLFFKHLGTPPWECLRRAHASGDQDIVPVIERMAAAWEPLGTDEASW